MSHCCAAAREGTTVGNYINVNHLLKDASGKISGANVTDLLTGKSWNIRARTVVNATGPFADSIRQMDDPEVQPLIVPAGGVHIVLPDHFSPERCVWWGVGVSQFTAG